MMDLIFAVIAAGLNSAGDDGSARGVAPATAQEQTAQAGTPSVIIGQNVTKGSGVVIGGQVAQAPAQSGGGSGLLAGTSEEIAAPQGAALQPRAQTQGGFDMRVVPAGLEAEPQTPTGKFTTATEVRPIMDATRGNWVAVREYNGQDLLYVTHIWGWRCGMKAMAISVNGEPLQNWPLPPCHLKYATPNAVLEEDGLPYRTLKLGAVETIDVQIVYDDLSMDAATFVRGNVLIP